ncbi:MAG TPA: DUF2497 domain-containing protein [Alphaproteobacteria bacterium]|nr:hypothetical protein [Rhodospirillaceae bacterium]HRJ12347.1 DUF2497 domain-containing protein [Alphaproteobacteria bacterium]
MTEAAPETAAAPAGGEEPSIEEILASIRKIISDEPPPEGEALNIGAQLAAATAQAEGSEIPDMPLPPATEAGASPPEKTSSAMASTAPETAPPALEETPDEILDLSAFAEDPDMAKKTKNTAPEAAAPAGDENLAFDLGLEDSTNNDSMSSETKIEDIMAASTFAPTPDAPEASVADSLVSDTSASVATAAMAKLAQAADPVHTDTQLWVGARTIEQVVEDLMRPMLKTWLDQNLPRLVERLVEKELARMARRATE